MVPEFAVRSLLHDKTAKIRGIHITYEIIGERGPYLALTPGVAIVPSRIRQP